MPADQQVAPEDPSTNQSEFPAFEVFTKKFADVTRVVGGDINRHAPLYMLGFGAATIIAAFASHVDGSMFTFTPAEFITLVIAGLIMICLGGTLIGLRLRSEAQVKVARSEQAQELLPRPPLIPGATLVTQRGDPDDN